jgi:selenocysteine lyase/cysteine desulfurase
VHRRRREQAHGTNDVIFASNTTEAINLAAESPRNRCAEANEPEPGIEPVVFNTVLEHNSNELPRRMVPGFSPIRLPVDARGFMDLNDVETLLCAVNQKGQHGKKRMKLVAVSGASNVLGEFNNKAEISRIVHRYGARLLLDAAQLVAHRKVEIVGCGIGVRYECHCAQLIPKAEPRRAEAGSRGARDRPPMATK